MQPSDLNFVPDRVMTVSRIKTRGKCNKQDEYRNGYGLSGPSSNALDMGSAVHDGTELFYLELSSGKGFEAAMDAATVKSFGQMKSSEHFKARDEYKVRAMNRAYFKRWAGPEVDPFDMEVHDSAFSDQLPEIQFSFKIEPDQPAAHGCLPGWTVAGMADALWRRKSNGKLYLREMKTTSDKSLGYFEKLWADIQVTLYCHDLTVFLGEPVVGVVYDVLRKITIRGSAKETDEEFGDRCEEIMRERSMLTREFVEIAPHVTQAALWRRMNEMRSVELNESEGVFPRNTESCYPAFGGWSCNFVNVCASARGLADPLALSGLSYRRPHSELNAVQLSATSNPAT